MAWLDGRLGSKHSNRISVFHVKQSVGGIFDLKVYQLGVNLVPVVIDGWMVMECDIWGRQDFVFMIEICVYYAE